MHDNEYISNHTLKRKFLLTILGIIFFSISLFIILSSLSFNFDETGWLVLSNTENKNIFGIFGSYISGFLLKEFGLLTPFSLALIFLMYSFKYFKHKFVSKLGLKLIFILALIFLSGLLSQPLHMFLNSYFFEESKLLTYRGFSYRTYEFILEYLKTALNISNDQIFLISNLFLAIFSVCIFVYIASTNFQELFFLKTIFKPFYSPIIWILQLLNNLLINKTNIEEEINLNKENKEKGHIKKLSELLNVIIRKKKKIQPKEEIRVNDSNFLKDENKQPIKKTNKQQNLPIGTQSGFLLPSIDLLINQKIENLTPDKDLLNANAKMLESVSNDYSIEGLIENVQQGPVVTRYDLKPAPGLRSQRVISLSDDIARSMLAESVRVAMVPGKNVIGIELPNKVREIVSLRHILNDEEFRNSNQKLPLCLGNDIAGKSIIADLSEMPHLLIAGTTGSGKSVGVNSMIISLLYKHTPETCRFIMIDPKMLELSVYDGIPHLLTPVVTDPKKAITALKWAVREMEKRYSLMSKLSVRNIENYNERLILARRKGEILTQNIQIGFDAETGQPVFEEEEIDLTPLPFIVILIDEVADLMLVAGKEIEAAVQRLAQMARAAGIHVVMATQRPSVDVITGTIKANFPTRISFQVTSKIDSRTILGEQGAEQLLGKGDMLFMAGGGKIIRVHGPFLNDKEVEKVTSFLTQQSIPEYDQSITEDQDNDNFNSKDIYNNSNGDELYQQAVDLVVKEQKASTSFIQRHFRIGYNRAATIIEKMEENNIISKPGRAGKREIILDQK